MPTRRTVTYYCNLIAVLVGRKPRFTPLHSSPQTVDRKASSRLENYGCFCFVVILSCPRIMTYYLLHPPTVLSAAVPGALHPSLINARPPAAGIRSSSAPVHVSIALHQSDAPMDKPGGLLTVRIKPYNEVSQDSQSTEEDPLPSCFNGV